ncbi:MarR family winged helix-turn-helix transcriptional regulator [Cupriavidus basilensis]|uniref:MarR family winged helix-turn-helix transcriptional regulator n=1 Tax=Cupriavidus basilensis TaxID=68895 RepID=A0ABT6B387_9BURK|nr:MarR family winged helix-turn-helix transcriptional regulator [Cupriavidus basilensis]MDF3839347.1 MarR family winged helix-turn-helix transcriptional regulator [Cupriavidus basilensis]
MQTLTENPTATMPPTNRLNQPQCIEDLLLYRLGCVLADAGGIVIRYCEGQFGITRREWRLLALLGAHGAQASIGSSALARLAHLDRPRASRAITSLVGKKLVSRVARAGDARQVTLALTAAGEALYAEVFPLTARVNLDLLDTLDEAEATQLDGMLARLQQRAQQMAARGGLPRADRWRGGRRSPPLPEGGETLAGKPAEAASRT